MSQLTDDLKNELKRRIRQDMEPLNKWSEALWAKITFGDYYGKTPEKLEVIHRVVGECIDNVLLPRNRRMTKESWGALQDDIDGSDTGESALPDMEEAALVTEERPADDAFEPLETGKPTTKPKGKKKAAVVKPREKKASVKPGKTSDKDKKTRPTRKQKL